MVKKFRKGIALDPQSVDPSSPVEGQLQYSDGTARDEGLHVFTNGQWSPVGGSSSASPKTIGIDNPNLENDISGWSVVGGTISRNTTNPLAGTADLEYVSDFIYDAGSDPGISSYDYVSYDIDLTNRVEISQVINIRLDLVLSSIVNSKPVNVQSFIGVYDNTNAILVGTYPIADSTNNLSVGQLYAVDADIDISSTSSTDLSVRIFTTSVDILAEAGTSVVTYNIDNLNVSTKTIRTVGNVSKRKQVSKYLTADITSSTSDVAGLRVTELVVGKSYRVMSQAHISSSAASGAFMYVKHDGTTLHAHRLDSGGANFSAVISGNSTEFTATSTEINIDTTMGSSTTLEGTTSPAAQPENTWVKVIELDYEVDEVSSF